VAGGRRAGDSDSMTAGDMDLAADVSFVVAVRLLSGRSFWFEVFSGQAVARSAAIIEAVFGLGDKEWDLVGPEGRRLLINRESNRERSWAEHGIRAHCVLQVVVLAAGAGSAG
jgi:hypothetical protein